MEKIDSINNFKISVLPQRKSKYSEIDSPSDLKKYNF